MEELPDIITGISKPDLFEKFKIQVKKDFENCSLDGNFAADLIGDYNVILNAVHSEVEKINKTASGKLNELLYRIDISEVQIKKALKLNPNLTFHEVVADLIIKRELQKIVIKEHFKSK